MSYGEPDPKYFDSTDAGVNWPSYLGTYSVKIDKPKSVNYDFNELAKQYETLQSLRRMRDDLDRLIKEMEQAKMPSIPVPPPNIYPLPIPPEQTAFDKYNEEPCLVREFFKNNPDATSVMISCPCKSCSPFCLNNVSSLPNNITWFRFDNLNN